MKIVKIIAVLLFCAAILIPVVTFNFKEDAVSEIDNRTLASNPIHSNINNFKKGLESYVNDRIGFRDEMILDYTLLNDRLFHKMVHPSYDYGKDGYVFFKYGRPVQFGEYHIAFADMVLSVQNYCTERGVPFVFVFEPEKKSVYTEFVADGVNYNNDWIRTFLHELDNRGVNYVDNTEVMIQKKAEGEQVFNQKFNAGHWNDLGAFYGVNSILENLQQFFPGIELNQKENFNIIYALENSLPVSQFPIHEEEPIFTYKGNFENLTSVYNAETKRDKRYRGFEYTVNEEKRHAGSPRTLVFQGSYMNGMGHKFFESALGEYIAVHDYQNILNFPYYFNLYKPECVVFEAAEYTFSSTYFDFDGMKTIDWNPSIEKYAVDKTVDKISTISKDTFSIDKGNVFSTIRWNAESDFEYVWLKTDGQEFDMECVDKEQNIYEVTIPNTYAENQKSPMHIIGGRGNHVLPFSVASL